MSHQLALFGGSFNPPGIHHRHIAEALAARFDTVLVVPCGPRDDKSATNLLPPVYRAAMADMAFADLAKVEVDIFDLEHDRFTRSHELDRRYQERGDVWHVVGVDLIKGGGRGASPIQTSWELGTRLWKEARFAVLTRPGYRFAKSDLPPRSQIIELDIPGSSTEIRALLARGDDASAMLLPRVLDYAKRYGLYRSPIPNTWARGTLADHRYAISMDPANEKAQSWLPHFSAACPELRDAEFVTILGGDGAMLRCIRENWRARLPFFGVNAGHLGFLMNRSANVIASPIPPQDVIFRQLPMLYIEIEGIDGKVSTTYGFNDAWVERSTSQSAWLELKVNGVRRITKMVSDGALVSTAAGSTAYARSMGAPPLLADTPAWLVVGSNVAEPASWKSALLSNDSSVEILNLDTEHRPVRAFVDGHDQGLVRALRARISKAAAAELVFNATHDMAEKIAAIQFGTSAAEKT